MSNYLVIVESPAKAKTIKKYLGKNFNVMASMGHLRDLPKSQMGVDIEHDFEPKYITIRGKGELVSKLKKEAKASDRVYLATDPDREGEAISWHLSKVLDLEGKECYRVSFNEITKNAVLEAIKNPREIDKNLVDAQQARRVLDRIVGYKISPILWRKIKKGLSAGRVQSVATRLIVDREREIESFVPKEYWTITAKLEGDKVFEAKFYGINGKKTELSTKEDVDRVLQNLEGAKYIVSSVKYGEKQKAPAPPFTTSTLQQEASRKLGFTANRTMTAAQQLYEGIEIKGHGSVGLITYMRTDSLRISVEAQSEAKSYILKKYGSEYYPGKPRVYKASGNAQDAHEAIRPTSMELEPERIKDSLTNDQYKIYKLVWDRFVASQMASAVYNTVNADISAADCVFKASGSTVKFPGYTVLYVEGSDASESEEDGQQGTIPLLEKGMELKLKKLDPKQHFTEPPPRYSEATLIRTMEEKGIGRPSTYAPTISTILARGYVTREKKFLKPTELGIIVTDLMKKYFSDIVDVEFTANMEQELDEIEEGQKNWREIVKEFYEPFEEVLRNAENEIGRIELKEEESDVICEKCGRRMVYKMGRFGKFLACPGFPECRNAKPVVEYTGAICPKCGGRILVKRSQKGKKYYGCERAPECPFVLWDEPTGAKCEKCGSLMVKKYLKSGAAVLCSNKDCENSRVKG